MTSALDSATPAHPGSPTRTCVGCRKRAVKTELLRVTARDGMAVPDPRSRLPGRGAYVHAARECLERAERRRAFQRALRAPGALDIAAVREWIEACSGE